MGRAPTFEELETRQGLISRGHSDWVDCSAPGDKGRFCMRTEDVDWSLTPVEAALTANDILPIIVTGILLVGLIVAALTIVKMIFSSRRYPVSKGGMLAVLMAVNSATVVVLQFTNGGKWLNENITLLYNVIWVPSYYTSAWFIMSTWL